jgi:hypothetical protein
MGTTVVIIVVAVVVIVLVLGVVLAGRARRRRELIERFGPEYDRAVSADGSSKRAEAGLRERADRRDKLSIRALNSAQRDRYQQDWRQVQAEFVDMPSTSLKRADALVTDVMVDRGYPMQDFDDQADLISVDHPRVVEHYRRAHGIYEASQSTSVSTEDMRHAFVSYRSVFAELVGDGLRSREDASDGNSPSASVQQPVFRGAADIEDQLEESNER